MRSARLPEPFVFFVDECIKCAAVRNALDAALLPGERTHVVAAATPDETWLEEAGRMGWVCISKDRRMLHNPNEIEAIQVHRVGLFTLGDASSEVHGQLVSAAVPLLRRAARQLDRSFVARIDKSGDLVVTYDGGVKLSAPRRLKPTRADLKAKAK